MRSLKRLLKKRKAKKYYLKCLKLYHLHGYDASCGNPAGLQLMEYWHEKAEEAWKEYERI